uniref:Uncharacterized protein n=1 Tax=Phytophthora infestans TaxID=4787 RepID=Q572G6_PHYIN|nr:hypothetical protein PI49.0170c [Phytophthora infestans]
MFILLLEPSLADLMLVVECAQQHSGVLSAGQTLQRAAPVQRQQRQGFRPQDGFSSRQRLHNRSKLGQRSVPFRYAERCGAPASSGFSSASRLGFGGASGAPTLVSSLVVQHTQRGISHSHSHSTRVEASQVSRADSTCKINAGS